MFTTTRRTVAVAAFALGVLGVATPAPANTIDTAEAEGFVTVSAATTADELPDAEGLSAIGPIGTPAN